jgi:hypothetical protein
MGLSTHQGPVTCMRALMGFVVGVRVVFGVVVGPVLGACIPVIAIGRWAYQGKKEEKEQINIVLFVNEN